MNPHRAAAVLSLALSLPAGAATYYQQDFESGAAGLSGGQVVASRGYAGHGFGSRL